MANKAKSIKKAATTAVSETDESTAVRIKAGGPRQSGTSKPPKIAKNVTASSKSDNEEPRQRNPLKALGVYFAGAWYELRQVRWPDRRSTWGLTGAVLLFTAVLMVIILLLDALFRYLFGLIYA